MPPVRPLSSDRGRGAQRRLPGPGRAQRSEPYLISAVFTHYAEFTIHARFYSGPRISPGFGAEGQGSPNKWIPAVHRAAGDERNLLRTQPHALPSSLFMSSAPHRSRASNVILLPQRGRRALQQQAFLTPLHKHHSCRSSKPRFPPLQ